VSNGLYEDGYNEGSKMDEIETARLKQLERCVPDIWEYNDVLYIGAGEYRHHFFIPLKVMHCIVTVAEIIPENCDWIRENHKWIDGVWNGDIRDFITEEPPKFYYNSIIWSHGVETLPKSAGPEIIKKLEGLVKNGVIVHMTPFGAAGGTGNVSVWHRGDFEKLGYQTDCLGNKDERNNNLLAWKYIK